MTSRREAVPRDVEKRLPLSPRDFHILFALAEENLHGYGLVRAVEEHSSGTLKLDPANLYRALQKLASEGLVADAERKPAAEADHERRRYYTITPLGRKVVAEEAGRLRDLAAAAVGRGLIPESGGSR